MAEYTVYVREIWSQAYVVEANSPDEAKKLVYNKDPRAIVVDNSLEFVDECDRETWTVDEE